MKQFVFVFVLLTSVNARAQEVDYRKVPSDFESLWTEFSSALKNIDKKKIEALSLSCIHCSECAENTEIEADAMNAERDADPDAFYDNFYDKYSIIPLRKFIDEDYDILLNEDVRMRSQDSTKIFYLTHDKLKTKELNKCARSTIKGKSAKHIEVLITVIDPSDTFEGAQFCLNFVETKDGYRFYAFYTIP